jgi:hypothetical protein
VMIDPERSRFMLAPSNAFWLLLNSATNVRRRDRFNCTPWRFSTAYRHASLRRCRPGRVAPAAGGGVTRAPTARRGEGAGGEGRGRRGARTHQHNRFDRIERSGGSSRNM